MSINSTEAVGTGLFVAPTTTSTTSGTSNTTSDKDTFLQLLVAQLKYQDPMNPTDSSQFLTQTAQFNALQEMQDVAAQTASLLSTSTAFGATNLIGKEVGYTLTDGSTASGTVTGVSYGSSGPVLSVGGADIQLTQIQSVAAQANA